MNRVSEKQRSRLKAAIRKGRARGFLTYDELRDELPENLRGADELEPVVAMFADLGVDIVDETPDSSAFLSAEESSADEDEAVDERAAAGPCQPLPPHSARCRGSIDDGALQSGLCR